jgi:hypothetical protein
MRNYEWDAMLEEKDYSATPKSEFVSNHFEVITTVMVDYDVFYNQDACFMYVRG